MSDELKVENVVEFLGNLSVMELIALTKQLEQDWQVEAKPMLQEMLIAPTQEETKAAQTEFSVVLVSFPADKKIAVIKTLREVSGLDLVSCKNLLEKLPQSVKEGLMKEQAEEMKFKLEEVGAKVELK